MVLAAMSKVGSNMKDSVVDNVKRGSEIRDALLEYLSVFEEYRKGIDGFMELEKAEKFYNETAEMYKWK